MLSFPPKLPPIGSKGTVDADIRSSYSANYFQGKKYGIDTNILAHPDDVYWNNGTVVMRDSEYSIIVHFPVRGGGGIVGIVMNSYHFIPRKPDIVSVFRNRFLELE